MKLLCRSVTLFFKYFYQVWPIHENDRFQKVRLFIMYGPFLITYPILWIGMYRFLSNPNTPLAVTIDNVTILYIATGDAIVDFYFYLKSGKIIRMLEHMSDFSEFGKPRTTDSSERRSNLLCYCFKSMAAFVVALYCSSGFLTEKTCLRENEELNIDLMCGMPFPISVPAVFYDIAPRLFWIFLACVSALVVAGLDATINVFLCAIVETILPRIDHLSDVLSEVYEQRTLKNQQEKLSRAVRYNQLIIGLVDEINDIFGFLYFVNMTMTVVIIGLLTFSYLVKHSAHTILHALCWVLALFVMSMAGQRLIDKNQELSMKVYSMPWYELPVSLQKDILFILMRSQREMYLSPIGFGKVTFLTFKDVMSNVYSLITLLTQRM